MLNSCFSIFLGTVFHSLISRELLISRTHIKNIFWKSMMRSFRWLEINCFNIFRFIAEVSTNFQKMHNFGWFFKKRKLDKWRHFFHLLFELCLYSFLYLIIAKIHFHGVLLSSILICRIPEFRDVSCEMRILPRSIQKIYTLRNVKNQVLLFLSCWGTKFVACPWMLFYIGLKLRIWNFTPIFPTMQFSLVATFILYFRLSVWLEIYILNFFLSF